MASQFLVVAERLLEIERRPMSARELTERGMANGMFTDAVSGKTPWQTMKSKLSVHIRRWGRNSMFVRTGKGLFYLRRLLNGEQEHTSLTSMQSASEQHVLALPFNERYDKYKLYNAPPLLPPPPLEHVLTFLTDWLDSTNRFQGIKSTGSLRFLQQLFRSNNATYIDRLEAETINSRKQIVTYILVTRGSHLLAFKRGNYNRAEAFLRGAHCIGFGGHVTINDVSLFDQSYYGIFNNAARELQEELSLPNIDKRRLEAKEGLSIIGLLNDDSSKTGERHFAVIMKYEVSGDSDWDRPKRNEKSITQLRWIDPDAPSHNVFEFEYWSQLCLREYFPKSNIAHPNARILNASRLRPPHLLVVLGQVGSGKSTTTNILKNDFSYAEVNSGRVLAAHLGLPPVSEETRVAFQEAAWEYINSPKGPNDLAKALWKQIQDIKNDRILLDGIRQKRTLEAIKRLAEGRKIGIVFVHTPPDIAYEFYRKRTNTNMSIFDFLKVQNAPVEAEVPELIKMADAVLYNWTGEGAYKRTVHAMMRTLGVQP